MSGKSVFGIAVLLFEISTKYITVCTKKCHAVLEDLGLSTSLSPSDKIGHGSALIIEKGVINPITRWPTRFDACLREFPDWRDFQTAALHAHTQHLSRRQWHTQHQEQNSHSPSATSQAPPYICMLFYYFKCIHTAYFMRLECYYVDTLIYISLWAPGGTAQGLHVSLSPPHHTHAASISSWQPHNATSGGKSSPNRRIRASGLENRHRRLKNCSLRCQFEAIFFLSRIAPAAIVTRSESDVN